VSPFHIHQHAGKLKCPYDGCGKKFERPTILTDSSTMPRQTFYACPHCMSKIDIKTENLKVVGIRAIEYAKVFDSPAKCARYSSFLNAMSYDMAIPDDCLVCPKILQCGIKKRWAGRQ
jgi:DNA-directed RNA polymerase subunit RPC12/RpoP